MAKLEWDQTGERFLEYGVDHGVLYTASVNSEYVPWDDDQSPVVMSMAHPSSGDDYAIATKYAGSDFAIHNKIYKGVPWNGLISVTESPDGADPNDLWADNMKYASLRSAETFGATIEAYTYPDEFVECDGGSQPVPGLILGQQTRKPFCFAYRSKIANDTATEADDGYLIHLIYNAIASPSEKSYETTNDSPDAISFSWDVDTTPICVDGYKSVSSITINSRKFSDGAGKETLSVIEAILFGDANHQPIMIPPDMVLKLTTGSWVSFDWAGNLPQSLEALETDTSSHYLRVEDEQTSVTMQNGAPELTSASNVYQCCVVSCTEGEIFTFTGKRQGTSSPGYVFLDDSGNILGQYNSSTELPETIVTAPAGSTMLYFLKTTNGNAENNAMWRGITQAAMMQYVDDQIASAMLAIALL